MMKTVIAIEPEIAPIDVLTPPLERCVEPRPAVAVPSRLADYLELTKPKIAVMALFTVGVGYLIGAAGSVSLFVLFHALFGAGLVAAGGSALNQWLERDIDARMQRTRQRPLPAGRLLPAEALAFGLVVSAAGLVYLFLTVPYPAGVIAAATLVTYVAIYTPLKTVTVWNTVVGAVPGALPPLIGWCAARGWESPEGGIALFLVIFVWQIPHFLAIAWMYREDYARGGLRMLPGIDPAWTRTAVVMISTCVALLAVSLWPVWLGIGGWLIAVGAIAAALYFLRAAIRFGSTRTDAQARKVLRASLLYLPAVFGLLLIAGCLPSSSKQTQPPEPPDLDFPVGEFKLTERSGKTVTDADLKGKVWVASFIFTRCSGPCPHVSATMAKLQAEMPNPKDMLFVTFTVDPEHDTPAVLDRYAKNFNADPDRWLFLTGPEKEMHELLTKRFKQAVEKNPAKDVRPGEEFFHSSRLAVVDRQGVIRAVFDGEPSKQQPDAKKKFDENIARLKSKLAKLLEE